MRRGERREDREAERAADLLRRVEEPGREAGVLRRHVRRREQRHRHELEPHADRDDHHGREEAGRSTCRERELRVEQHAAGRDREAGEVTARTPIRLISDCAAPAPITIPNVNGRKARPALIGL